ncbi:MAG: 50S ribosomal protein L11 methyltransferase [Thermovirgaceae bacterium]
MGRETGYWWYITIEMEDGSEETLFSLAELSGSIGSEFIETSGKSVLKSYYRSTKDLEYWLGRVRETTGPWASVNIVDMGKIENRSWHKTWKEAFPPLEVGEGLVVMAPWHEKGYKGKRTPLLIYPGSAFGTGYHESTQIALELIERHVAENSTGADIGTGSGILAVAAVRTGAGKVYARDLDPAVLAEARENLRLNGIDENTVVLEEGDLLKGFQGPVDFLTANIVFDPLMELLPGIAGILAPGGTAIFSGLSLKEKENFLRALGRTELVPFDEVSKGDWWGVAATLEAGKSSKKGA